MSISPDGKTPPRKKVEGNDCAETGEGEGAGAKKKRPRKRKAVEPPEGEGGKLLSIQSFEVMVH